MNEVGQAGHFFFQSLLIILLFQRFISMMVKNTYMKLYFVLMIFSWKNYLYEAIDVSAKNSLVWGPGLDARVTLPARYFFVQSVDRGHKK